MGALKKKLVNEIFRLLEEKINTHTRMIKELKESRDSFSKSSVGDKYETRRAMTERELDKYEVQLNGLLTLKQELSVSDCHRQRQSLNK